MSVRKGSNIISYGQLTVESMARNLGELIYSSMPLDSTCYHLADGSVLSGGGEYSTFVEYMANLRDAYSDAFTTEANWQSTVSSSVTGSCGKYVYDPTNNTLRLPKLNGILKSTTTKSQVGDLTSAGLPSLFTVQNGAHTHTASTGNESAHTHDRGTMNISGSFQGGKSGSAVSGVFSRSSGVDSYTTGTANMYTITFTASKNWTGRSGAGSSHNHTATINSGGGHTHTLSWSPTVQSTNTVQPETTKVLVYIVVKAIGKSTAVTNFNNFTYDLNTKADKDLSNISLSKNSKYELGHLFFPSDNYIDITLPTSGSIITAPADGFYSCGISGTASSSYMELWTSRLCATANYSGGWGATFIPVKAGDNVTVYYGGTTFTLQFFRFTYAESEV